MDAAKNANNENSIDIDMLSYCFQDIKPQTYLGFFVELYGRRHWSHDHSISWHYWQSFCSISLSS